MGSPQEIIFIRSDKTIVSDRVGRSGTGLAITKLDTDRIKGMRWTVLIVDREWRRLTDCEFWIAWRFGLGRIKQVR
jgi:hypothetical protein